MVSYGYPFVTLCVRRVRKDVRAHIGKVETDSVATGFGRTLGNKVRHSTAQIRECINEVLPAS